MMINKGLAGARATLPRNGGADSFLGLFVLAGAGSGLDGACGIAGAAARAESPTAGLIMQLEHT